MLLNNAPIQVRARLLLSVAERWALLFRKARGLQILTARVVFRRWDETSRAADAGMITDTLGTFLDDRESFAGDSEGTETWDLVPPNTTETETNEYAGSQGPSSSGTASGQERKGKQGKGSQEGNTPTASGQDAAPVPNRDTASGQDELETQPASAHDASASGQISSGPPSKRRRMDKGGDEDDLGAVTGMVMPRGVEHSSSDFSFYDVFITTWHKGLSFYDVFMTI